MRSSLGKAIALLNLDIMINYNIIIKTINQNTIMQVKGIIKNNRIELLDDIDLTEGTEVIVEISDNSISSKDNQWQKLQKVIGSWENDSEIDTIFNDIDKERHKYHGRNIDFEDFS